MSTENRFIVFYGEQIFGEYTKGNMPPLPAGAYILDRTPHYGYSAWYLMIGGGLSPINLRDLPAHVKAWCMVLGIKL